jgi:head-tail adaptor
VTVNLATAARPHRIHLENPGPRVPDGEGGWTVSWEPLTPPTLWASIAPASSVDLQRVVSSEAVQATATHVVTSQFHAGVTVETRVTWYRMPKRPDRYFLVQAVQNPDEREIAMVLSCVELLGQPGPPPSRSAEDTDGRQD